MHLTDNEAAIKLAERDNLVGELVDVVKEVFSIGERLVDDVYGYDFVQKAKAVLAKAQGAQQ